MRLPLLASLIGLLALPAAGRFMNLSEPVPIDRLVTNVGEYVERHPDDAAGHYTLGRIHSLAYAKLAFANPQAEDDPSTVRVTPAERLNERRPPDDQVELPAFLPYDSVQVGKSQQADAADAAPRASPEARAHLAASLKHYEQAVRLDPARALYALGYGWMLEQAALYPRVDDPTSRPATRPAELLTVDAAYDEAARQYRNAFELAFDAEVDGHLAAGDTPISVEAGTNLIRLLRRVGTNEARRTIREVRERVAKVQAAPRAITPILFSLDGLPLSDLLDDAARVDFDIAADGLTVGGWTWVTPEASLLVWDPRDTGDITSGTQLIGGRTWGMFWRDGYEALAALDDDRDGQLTKSELVGLAAWTDANGNAASDPGEVVPLLRLGVRAIRVDGESHPRDDAAAWNGQGITMTDERVLATWDWIARREAGDE